MQILGACAMETKVLTGPAPDGQGRPLIRLRRVVPVLGLHVDGVRNVAEQQRG